MPDPRVIAVVLLVAVSFYGVGRINGYVDGYDGRAAEVGLLRAERDGAELRLQICQRVANLAVSGGLAGYEPAQQIAVPCGGAR